MRDSTLALDSEKSYWTWSPKEALEKLNGHVEGIGPDEVNERLKIYGPNQLLASKKTSVTGLLWKQVSNPLIGILIFAAFISAAVQEWTDALIVVFIILLSAFLGFVQEFRATKAIQLLLQRIAYTITVRRNQKMEEVAATEIVPGDIIQLNAGTLIPADGILLESKDLFVNQAVLTGESMPAEKNVGVSSLDAPLSSQTNVVFAGTSVRSGTATLLVVETGVRTRFGKISGQLEWRDNETDFEKGLRQFGFLLTRIMIIFVLFILVGNIWLHKPLIDSVLFSIALAVGLSPELLPAVLTVTLAKGAVKMAKRGVIVRRLNCIESLGNIEVLCCDKTGTLTQGRMTLKEAVDLNGNHSDRVLELGYLNAFFQTGIKNPLDETIVQAYNEKKTLPSEAEKIDEIPYDFIRRRLTIVIRPKPSERAHLMIMKGATTETLQACANLGESSAQEFLKEKIQGWGTQGLRVLAVATREINSSAPYTAKDEHDFKLEGFLLFQDPPHVDARDSLAELKELGVNVKIITGDNQFVAEAVAKAVGLSNGATLTGAQIHQLSPGALLNQVDKTTIFAEVDPQQKENIILALKKRNFVVGYMGDGINDAPALLAADVGISVESAVDVAKESADLVLTRHDLRTILAGITEGRVTFANTLKYIYITTSANFGNMLSMAFASLFLPFLPLLATQVLLNNLLSDLPALAIGNDRVDRDWRKTPHRWNLRAVRRQMIGFGLISSIFDLITFVAFLFVFHTSVTEFQTGWFVESLLTEILIVFVVRSYQPFFRSQPDRWLVIASLAVIAFTAFIFVTPLKDYFSFVVLKPTLVFGIFLISGLYVATSEALKRWIMVKP